MKKIGIALFIGMIGWMTVSFTASVQEENEKLEWHTDLDEVHELSKKSGKPIFGFFTGSDWCGWCHKLEREVFAKDAFVKWANDNVILFELDFPRKKQLPPDLAKQNRELQQAFQVSGYPTIWIFTSEKDEKTDKFNMTAWGKLGYPRGAQAGKEEVKFIKDANAVLAKDPSKKK